MSRRARAAPIVSREYRIEPDACEKAVEILLKGHVKKGGSSSLTTPDDAMKGSRSDRATSQSTR
jgi:hypothetical protein